MEQIDERVLELTGTNLSDARAGRQFVGRSLHGKAPAGVISDLKLATSELITNAYWHRASAGPVTIRVEADDSQAAVAVQSFAANAADLPPFEMWAMPGADQVGGRGLGIVRAVTDRVDVEREGSKLTILVSRYLG